MSVRLANVRNFLVGVCFLVGLYIAIADIVLSFEYSRNLCANGCGMDSVVIGALGGLMLLGLGTVIAYCRKKGYPIWIATVERVTLYCWVAGLPLVLFLALVSGPM